MMTTSVTASHDEYSHGKKSMSSISKRTSLPRALNPTPTRRILHNLLRETTGNGANETTSVHSSWAGTRRTYLRDGTGPARIRHVGWRLASFLDLVRSLPPPLVLKKVRKARAGRKRQLSSDISVRKGRRKRRRRPRARLRGLRALWVIRRRKGRQKGKRMRSLQLRIATTTSSRFPSKGRKARRVKARAEYLPLLSVVTRLQKTN